MKTALQQAFSRLEELHPDLFDMHSQRGRTFVNEFHQFLEMEKEQIIDTWNNAINAVEKDKWESFEQYYKETFKSE